MHGWQVDVESLIAPKTASAFSCLLTLYLPPGACIVNISMLCHIAVLVPCLSVSTHECLCLPQFLPPVFLPVPRVDGSYSHLRGQHGIIAFMSNDGSIGAYNAHGQRLWMVSDTAPVPPCPCESLLCLQTMTNVGVVFIVVSSSCAVALFCLHFWCSVYYAGWLSNLLSSILAMSRAPCALWLACIAAQCLRCCGLVAV